MTNPTKTISHSAGIERRERDAGFPALREEIISAANRVSAAERYKYIEVLEKARAESTLRKLEKMIAPVGKGVISVAEVEAAIADLFEAYRGIRATLPPAVVAKAQNAARVARHRKAHKRSIDVEAKIGDVFRGYAEARGISLSAALDECVTAAKIGCAIGGWSKPTKTSDPIDVLRKTAVKLGERLPAALRNDIVTG